MENSVIFALILTLIAGLATSLGSLLAVFAKRTNTRFLACSLGFSAGVMIYISMIELFKNSESYLAGVMGDNPGYIAATASFFGGVILIALIDYFIPSAEGDIGSNGKNPSALSRVSLVTALAIAIHNFPEGMVTFTSALKEPHLGIAIAISIAIHNIPEGIAMSLPIYYSTGSKKKAFFISFLSGFAEPIGAIIGYLILKPFLSDGLFGVIFGAIAGIMVFISIEELLPMAREYEKSKITIGGFIIGMAVIALSFILFL